MLLITGWPGVGKTTAVRAVAERLRARGARVDGFVTLERRDAATGARVGFDAVNLDGSRRAPLAIAKARGQDAATTPRVGKYAVDVESFESVALSVIERSHDVDVLVVDEIGKMELLSPRFERAMREWLLPEDDAKARRPRPILVCTVAKKGEGLIARAKARATARGSLVDVTVANRDSLVEDIVTRVGCISDSHPSASSEPSLATPPGAADESASAVVAASARATLQTTGDDCFPPPPCSADEPARATLQATGDDCFPPPARPDAGDLRRRGGGRAPARRAVVWLRDDLRVDHDAPLFAAALARSPTELIVVYLVEPRDRLRADGPPTEVDSMLEEFGIGDGGFEGARCAMGAFVAQALLDVRDALAARGARLLVLRAPPRAGCVALEPERVLRELVSNEGETVFVASKCAVGAAAAAQARARAALELEVVHDGLCAFCGAWPAELLGDDGSFASFERALLGGARGGRGARSVPPRPEAPAAPQRLPPTPPLDEALAALNGIARIVTDAELNAASEAIAIEPRGGESAALAQMERWLACGGPALYTRTFRTLLPGVRDGPHATSRLGAALARGCLSARRLAARVMAISAGSDRKFGSHFLYELRWRDYFRAVACARGPEHFAIDDAEVTAAWCSGEFGLPLIDAAVRELVATGFLGNLARELVASFATAELGVGWRAGAQFFAGLLLDHDPHTNAGQWRRAAEASGDAKARRVGDGRYLEIALALPRDEASRYVQRWVPELSQLGGAAALVPWRFESECARVGIELGVQYPRPPTCETAARLGRWVDGEWPRKG